jgi:hypothetical protein
MHDLARPRITIHVICMTGGPIFTTKDIVDSDDHEENASAAVRGTHEHVGRGSGSDCESEEDLPVFGAINEESGRLRSRHRQSTGSGAATQSRAFWGDGPRRRRASWAATAGLGRLLSSPPGHGRLGPSPPTSTPTTAIHSNDDIPAAKRRAGKKVLVNRNWSDAQLRSALFAVERESPVQTTALDFDIPRSTLRNHVMGLSVSRKRGRKLVLSKAEEEKVVQYILGTTRYGHPINITELKIKVAEATQL